MAENDENKVARSAQEEEMEKLGLTPESKRNNKGGEEDSDSDEDEDEDTEDQEDEEESEDEEEDSEEEDESENEDEEDEEEEDDQSHKKKGTSEFFGNKESTKIFNAMRSDLRKANEKIQTLLEKKTPEAEKKAENVPEDFIKRVEAISKEVGIENPEGLKKIMALVDEVMKGTEKNFEKKLADLEEKYGKMVKETPVKDDFETEWETFTENIAEEYPDATKEELKAAQKLMNELSHTPGVGGKPYKDAEGRELLDPYELDYVYFKNQGKFKEIFSGKKVKGLESNRSQGINRKGEQEENKPLRANASAKEIRDYEKRSSKVMEGMDSMSAPVDDTI
jgi:hypothetical protein